MLTDFQLLERARLLRRDQTKVEAIIWELVRNKKLSGLKFKRQVPFGNYILDFYCEKKNLAIELDGSHHGDKNQVEYDKKRTKYLESCGVKVIRVWNDEVLKDLEAVWEYLNNELK